MIGLSLSFCVKDILEGNVSISEVEKLVTSTSCTTDEEFNSVINQYKKIYWYKYSSDQIDNVIKQLKPLIYQPRITENKIPMIHKGIWVNSMNDIEYRDY